MTSDSHLPARTRVVLTGISSRAWEHPADRGALTALRELRGFDDVLKALSGLWNERALRLEFLGGAIRVDHRQYPRVYRLFAEAASALDLAELPELYVQYDRSINGMCIGMAKPFIVINSGSLELLDDEELRGLLGHEVGHLLSGHAVYRTMAMILRDWATRLAWLPVGSLALRAIHAGLREWWRKAELSADRAGLLAGQDPAAMLRLEMKLAGGGDLSEVDTAAFLEQAAEYDRAGDLRDSLIKLGMVVERSHPVPVARAAALRAWIESGEYQRVLAGDYPRRDDQPSSSVREDIKAAASSYRESFARSQDPLVSLLRRLGDGASDWANAGADRIRTWMTGPANGGGRSGPSGGGGPGGPGAGGPGSGGPGSGGPGSGGPGSGGPGSGGPGSGGPGSGGPGSGDPGSGGPGSGGAGSGQGASGEAASGQGASGQGASGQSASGQGDARRVDPWHAATTGRDVGPEPGSAPGPSSGSDPAPGPSSPSDPGSGSAPGSDPAPGPGSTPGSGSDEPGDAQR